MQYRVNRARQAFAKGGRGSLVVESDVELAGGRAVFKIADMEAKGAARDANVATKRGVLAPPKPAGDVRTLPYPIFRIFCF